MRIHCLPAIITMAMLMFQGCGANTKTTPPEAFAIDGAWSYLGPSDVPHTLTISDASMVYTDMAGQWSSRWTIKAYDNGLHHFQVVFDSGSGTYLPVGQNMSGTYDLNATTLTVQVASGFASYPPMESPGSCTAATDGTPIPDCRLYIKQ